MLGARYLQVLRLPGTARLLLPALLARIPDSIAATGIVILARSATGSYSAAGLAAGTFGIGTAVSAPVAGRALDRLGQRRVLPALAAAFAGVLTILVLAGGGGGSEEIRLSQRPLALPEAFVSKIAGVAGGNRRRGERLVGDMGDHRGQ